MAYVAPNTTIRLLKGVRCDPRYENTIYFYSDDAQRQYFQGKTKNSNCVLTAQSYQRKNRGYIRVNLPFEEVIDCNYLMYQNTSFGSKWFYAFITNVEYINNDVCEIRFSIDVLQTYHFDYNIGACYVEREHVSNDRIGLHTIDEPVPIPEYFYTTPAPAPPFVGYTTMIVTTVPSGWTQISQQSGIFNGLIYRFFTTPDNAYRFIEDLVDNNKADSIVSIVMIPAGFTPTIIDPKLHTGDAVETYDWDIGKNTGWTYSYNGRTGPRNNKLYTFPFTKLIISDHNTATAEYRQEFFADADCKFRITASICPDPEFTCYPVHYQGSDKNVLHQITSAGYPQCAWSADVYRMWLAQNRYKIAFGADDSPIRTTQGLWNVISPLAVGAAGIASGHVGLVGSAARELSDVNISPTNIIDTVRNDLATVATVKSIPPQMRGVQSPAANMIAQVYGFNYYYAHITSEGAAIADDFFDAYGYSCCQVKQPNRAVRNGWTYCKTSGAFCVPANNSSVPADDAVKIQQIYDNGIRYWRPQYADSIGDYTINNDPL